MFIQKIKQKIIFYNKVKAWQALNEYKAFDYKKEYRMIIHDENENAGLYSNYYWQDLWAATKILEKRPQLHFDIGSRIDGFIAHLQCSKQKVVLIDIRPVNIKLPYVSFIKQDATQLSNIPDNSIESISSLSAIEHFGLGRYGDSICPEACFSALNEIARVVKPGGYAYISVPIGYEHVEFNAHRIFYPQTIIDNMHGMELKSLYVNTLEEDMKLIEVKDIHIYDDELNNARRFGLFEFKKSDR